MDVRLYELVENHFGNTHAIQVKIENFTLHREFKSLDDARAAVGPVISEACARVFDQQNEVDGS